MRRILPVLLIALSASPATAAERKVVLTSFDRLRVDGPVSVRVVTRGSPGARIVGVSAALSDVAVTQAGGTVTVRPAGRPSAGTPIPTVELSTGTLQSASVSGEGVLTLSGPLDAARTALAVTGRGTLTADRIATAALLVTLVGEGQFRLAGRAASARIMANGGGMIAASDLIADDAFVRSEGFTAIALTARYTANASTSGRGIVTILGKPECKYRETVTDTVVCHERRKF